MDKQKKIFINDGTGNQVAYILDLLRVDDKPYIVFHKNEINPVNQKRLIRFARLNVSKENLIVIEPINKKEEYNGVLFAFANTLKGVMDNAK